MRMPCGCPQVGDDFSASPFESAFERAKLVQELKSAKKRYARQLL